MMYVIGSPVLMFSLGVLAPQVSMALGSLIRSRPAAQYSLTGPGRFFALGKHVFPLGQDKPPVFMGFGWHVEPMQAYDSRLKCLGINDLLPSELITDYTHADRRLRVCCCFHLHIT